MEINTRIIEHKIVILAFIIISGLSAFSTNSSIRNSINEISTSTTHKITSNKLFLNIEALIGEESLSYNSNLDVYYRKSWNRKIKLQLPLGFKNIYDFPIVIDYKQGTIVWIGRLSALVNLGELSDIDDFNHEGIFEPNNSIIDTLIKNERQLKTTLFRKCGYDVKHIRLEPDILLNKTIKCKPVLYYLRAPKKHKRAVMSVKDDVFVLAYNIHNRDFPLFEAFIRNTFVVCSRYMDIVNKNLHEYYSRSSPKNVVRSQYMQHRFYKEIPTVTPPDSAKIVDDAWRGTGFTPDMFPNIYLEHPLINR